MKLELHERIVLLELLPKEGDYAALKTIRRAREMLAITPEEQTFYEFKEVRDEKGNLNYNWNPMKAREQVKDCPVDEYTTDLFREKLAELNRSNKLTENYVSLFEKFVIAYI